MGRGGGRGALLRKQEKKRRRKKERKKERRGEEEGTRWRAEVGGTYYQQKTMVSIVLLLRVQLFVLNYSLSFSLSLSPSDSRRARMVLSSSVIVRAQ